MFKNTMIGLKRDYRVLIAKIQNKVIALYIRAFMNYCKKTDASNKEYKEFYEMTVLFAKNNSIIKNGGI